MGVLRGLAVGLLALVVLALPAPAEAESAKIADSKDDVFVYDWMTDDADYGWWNPDISGVKVIHTVGKVITVTRFHRLRRYPWDRLSVFVDSDADVAPDYRFEIDDENDDRGVFTGRFGFRKVCRAEIDVNFADDFVKMSAPRSCFGNPGAVRVKAEFWSSWGPDCCDDWATDETRWTTKARRG